MHSQAFYLEAGIGSRKWENIEVVYKSTLRFPLLIFNARERDATAKSNARKKKAEQLEVNPMEGPYTIAHLLEQAAEQEMVKRTQERVHWREQAKTIGHRQDSNGKFSFEGERGRTRILNHTRGIPKGDCEFCGLTGHDVPECSFYLAIKKEHEASNPKPGRPNTSVSSRISSIIEATARLSIQDTPVTAAMAPIPSSSALAAITATARLPIEADSTSAVTTPVVSISNGLTTALATAGPSIQGGPTPVASNSIITTPSIPTLASSNGSLAIMAANALAIMPTPQQPASITADTARVSNGSTRASDYRLRPRAIPSSTGTSRSFNNRQLSREYHLINSDRSAMFDNTRNSANNATSNVTSTSSKKSDARYVNVNSSNSVKSNSLKRKTYGCLRLTSAEAKRRKLSNGRF